MQVIRAKTAGFCMGVALALKKLDGALAEHQDRRILTLGPIIHNPQVLELYARRGVTRVDSPEDTRPGDGVIIRAHGIPRQDEEHLRLCDVFVVDATCPKVKRAQLAIAKATRRGCCLLLFGESNHPEVRGLVSYAAAGAHVFDSLESLHTLELRPDRRYVLASQTTQDQRIFDAMETYLRQKHPDMPTLSTICDATRERQDEAMEIASRVEGMVVVGGRDSGNTRRLADVAAARGVPTWHVETPEELDPKNFLTTRVIGLTAGASTPKSLIDAIESLIAHGLAPKGSATGKAKGKTAKSKIV